MALLRGIAFAEKNYIRAEEIFRARAVADPRLLGRSVQQIYAQMWGLAYFLLHNTEHHRRLLIECLRREQELRPPPGMISARTWDVYFETFAEYGMPVAEIDEAYKKSIRSIDFSGKPKKR